MGKPDSKLREEIGIYEQLMEDFEEIANVFIGNVNMAEMSQEGEYQPLLKLLAEFHFSPESIKMHDELISRIKGIEKKLLNLRGQIDSNHQKGKFICSK